MNIGIYGYGYVGQHMHELLKNHYRVYVDDPNKGLRIESWEKHELAIICTPTPRLPDGSCDTSAVKDAVSRTPADLVLIKSTVPPGTTADLGHIYMKSTVFSPEYMGESKYYTPPQFPDPRDSRSHGFMLVGGHPVEASRIVDLFLPVMGPTTRFRIMTSREAELVKYAENSFFALKVTFANELRRIAERIGCNYHVVREGWLDDPRVGPMHTAAFKNAPGFGGKCLPKDISALAAFCRSQGIPSALLEAVIDANEEIQ